jgi:dihydroxy-acid dehydratase
MAKMNKYSSRLTEDLSQVSSRAMLYGAGLTDEDMTKPQVGVVSSDWDGNTCNMHLDTFGKAVKASCIQAGLVGLQFHTIGVSDGISMGTDGMNASLPSRDVIADSIETVMRAQWYDGLVAIMGCDKNMPGSVIAMGRLDRPAIMVYGGTIAPGYMPSDGRVIDIVSTLEAYGRFLTGECDEAELKSVVKNACPGAGGCGGMYTANTMATAAETLGMTLPYSSSNPAVGTHKRAECSSVGAAGWGSPTPWATCRPTRRSPRSSVGTTSPRSLSAGCAPPSR